MDYSKKGIEFKKNNIKSSLTRSISKLRIFLFRLLLVFIVFLAFVGSYAGIGLAKGLIESAPDISEINVVPTEYRTTMYDVNGNPMQTLIGAHSNRVYVTIDEIPKVLQRAFISIEDERFYEHDGIDVRGIFRAFFKGLSQKDFDQGASTITQQLLKNQVFGGGNEDNFLDKLERKIQEQYLAIQLENRMDKDQILEYYLNTLNLSSGTYGVQTAARRYFNKDVGDINLSEAAVIAAIAQSPVYRNPINYTDKNAERRSQILNKMLELGFCTKDEYEEAVNDDVYSRILSINEDYAEETYYSYFVDATIEQVLNDLHTKKGYSQSQASQLLYSRGLQIHTTLDPTIQKICDDVYKDESFFPDMGTSFWELNYALSIEKPDGTTIHYHNNDLFEYYKDFDDPDNLYINEGPYKFSLNFFDKDDMNEKIKEFRESVVNEDDLVLGEKIDMVIQPQSSFIIMDQRTGYVAGMIGGRGLKSGNRTLNRATDSVRLPGSTFKILSTFLPALDSAGLTLASVKDDAPYNYPGTERLIQNWDLKTAGYAGLSSIRKAIWHSMNIVTVKTLEDVTPQTAYNYLSKLGFTTLVESRVEPSGAVVSDLNYSMALGGLTDGVKNIELTAAFAAIANEGVYNSPILYTKIIDNNGKVILDNESQPEQVMKESTAWLLTNAMEDVVKIGTGGNLKLNNMPVAGKTGTTSSNYDLWFSGYTPYYTASIWSGYDTNRNQVDRRYHQVIWRTIMQRVHDELELENRPFKIPDSIVTARICSKSGKLAVDGLCDKTIAGNTTKTEYFAKGTAPTEKCDMHIKVNYCTKGKALATPFCPPRLVEERIFLNKVEVDTTKDTPYVIPSTDCNYHSGDINNAIPTINDIINSDIYNNINNNINNNEYFNGDLEN